MLQQKFSVFPLNLVKPITLTASVRRITWAFTGAITQIVVIKRWQGSSSWTAKATVIAL